MHLSVRLSVSIHPVGEKKPEPKEAAPWQQLTVGMGWTEELAVQA